MKRRYLALAPLLGAAVWMTPQSLAGPVSPLTPARWRSAEASRPVIAERNIVKPRLTAAQGEAR